MSVLLILASSSYATEGTVYTEEDIEFKGDIVYDKKTNTPINGFVKRHYNSGELWRQIPVAEGMVSGAIKDFYKSGKLKIIAPFFVDGEKHGHQLLYYESSELMSDYLFDNGNITGVVKQYYKSGKLQRKAPVWNSKKNGVEIFYFESGTVKAKITYQSGKERGEAKSYFKSGKLQSSTLCENGVAISGSLYNEKGTKARMTKAYWKKINKKMAAGRLEDGTILEAAN